jgi:hypothetical protein
MNTAELTTPPQASESPSFGDLLTEVLPWGRVLLAVPVVLLVLMLSGPFLFLVTIVVALVAVAMLVALAGAILASPYLLVRHIHGRLAERRHSAARSQSGAGSVPVPRVIGQTGGSQ